MIAILFVAIGFSLLTLQLGLSYWMSGAISGSILSIFVLVCCADRQVLNFRFHTTMLFSLLLPFKIIASASSLRDLRVFVIMFLYIFVFSSIHSFSHLKTKPFLSPLGKMSGIILVILTLIKLWLATSSSALSYLIFFLDKWLIANKTFENYYQALQASNYQYLGLYDRFSLLYGEPSYLAVVLFASTFALIYYLVYLSWAESNRNIKSNISALCLMIAVALGILLMISCGSLYGLICALFALYFLFYFKVKLQSLLPSRLRLLAIVFFTFLLFLSFSFSDLFRDALELHLVRLSNVLAGSDASSDSRLYPISLFFRFPFGYNDQAMMMAIHGYGIQSVDNGILDNLIRHGVLFIFFAAPIFISLLRRSYSYWPYCIYVFMVWSQSGNIFSPDKFFLTVLPIPLVVAVTKALRVCGKTA